jgi:pilus assembly protein Flp/PilA
MSKLILSFLRREDGATAIEYGLLASLIAVAIIATVSALGGKLAAVFQKVQDSLNS